MSKHTPGPWIAEQAPDGRFEVNTPVDGFFITSTIRYAPGDPTGEANARLIAAAPELLEALRECVAWIAADNGPRERACAAILKAEGV